MMNKHKEAFDNIVLILSNINNSEFNKANKQNGLKFFESMTNIEELVKRATPKKIIVSDKEKLFCPNCMTNYRIMTFSGECAPNFENPFCGECGQALDWSDERW